jgi:threonyl-tRNA synthetase
MIHRALFGSIERFFGILVEHYAGKFPLWLSPRQVRLIPVAEKHGEFAEGFAARLRGEGIRVDMESFDESVPKRVRKAQLDQVNYILVLGDQEMNGSHLAVRTRDNVVHNGVDREQFIEQLKEEQATRAKQSILKSEA